MGIVRVALAGACLLSLVSLASGRAVREARADNFDPSTVEYIEDPFAPHVTNGPTARVGTVIGYVYGQRSNVLAIGAMGAFGQRFGRLTLEAEAAAMELDATDADNATIGDAERLGVIARYDVIRLGPHVVGPNSMLSIYVEGGAARAWNHYYRPDSGMDSSGLSPDTARVVPDDSARVEGEIGFGIMLDHRLQEPISFPRRIGWFLGWRLGYAPHANENAVVCRGVSCDPAPAMPQDTYVDRSMLFQSSLSVTW